MQLQYFAAIFLTKIAILQFLLNGARELQVGGDKMKNHYGVYGIYFNKKLVYIGKTSRNFYQRFSEHKSNMKYQGGKLYEEMRKFKDKNVNNKINCIPLISFDCEFDNISDRDLSCMEYALITYLKPRLNREGVIRKFRF